MNSCHMKGGVTLRIRRSQVKTLQKQVSHGIIVLKNWVKRGWATKRIKWIYKRLDFSSIHCTLEKALNVVKILFAYRQEEVKIVHLKQFLFVDHRRKWEIFIKWSFDSLHFLLNGLILPWLSISNMHRIYMKIPSLGVFILGCRGSLLQEQLSKLDVWVINWLCFGKVHCWSSFVDGN